MSLVLKVLLLLVGLPVAVRLIGHLDRAGHRAPKPARWKGLALLTAFLATGGLAVLSLAAVDREWGEPIARVLRLCTGIGAGITAIVAFYIGYSDSGPEP